MPTQRLILLFTLVAVLGGCSIWYTKMILPATLSEATTVTESTTPNTVPTEKTAEPTATKSAKVTTTAPAPVTVPTPAAPGTLDADTAAIAASADATYADGDAAAEFQNEDVSSVTDGYGI